MNVKDLPILQIVQNFALRLVTIIQFDFTNVNVNFSSFSNHSRTNRECSAAVWFLFATCRRHDLKISNTSGHHKGIIGSGNRFPELIRTFFLKSNKKNGIKTFESAGFQWVGRVRANKLFLFWPNNNIPLHWRVLPVTTLYHNNNDIHITTLDSLASNYTIP